MFEWDGAPLTALSNRVRYASVKSPIMRIMLNYLNDLVETYILEVTSRQPKLVEPVIRRLLGRTRLPTAHLRKSQVPRRSDG